jgi:Flp pilus assembly protein TadD
MGFLRMARTEEALKEFQTAALLDPGFSRAEVGLSLALLQAGKKEGALSVLVRAGRMAPRDQLIQTLLKEVREP